MVILYALGVVTFILFLFYFLFSRFSFAKISEENTNTSISTFPVSLIVCAKNEAENLKQNIPLWLEQNHPDFELILINDASNDDTLEIMESFAETDSRIKICNVENNEAFWASKKYALTLGIKKATRTRLIFTDADCSPASQSWLKNMSQHFSEEKQVLLGYGAYKKEAGLLNALIRFETAMTAIQYFSYAQSGMPYMGVGRNLGYTSQLFYKHNGFISHIKIPSGDDDLFVNEVADSKNTAIVIDPNTFTYSEPKKTWKAWITQKRRHVSTAKHYKKSHRILLGLYYTCRLLFFVLIIAVMFTSFWKIGLILLGAKILFQYLAIGFGAAKLKEKTLIPFILFLDLLLLVMQLTIFMSNRTSKPTKWK
ncbi:MAG: glycosyltransferase [Patiriisocius sp.]|uniref:glycosyltransferase n=1 Tax=Patiriisocius sp. TaxID=2822396 RepID=UPI003EF98545